MPGLLKKKLPSISIRYALPGLLALLIIVAVSLTGWLVFRNGQQAVNELVTRLSAEVTVRVEEHVLSFLEVPHLFHQVNVAAVKAGNLNLDNYDELARTLWSQVHISESVPYIYLGTKEGYFFGVDSNFGSGQAVFKVKDASSGSERITYRLDDAGRRAEELERDPFDTNERPWYQAAVREGKATWSPIYPFSSRPVLGITAVTPIYDQAGQIDGVWGIDLTLSELTDFLRSFEVSPNGEIVIIEKSGDLVATSGDEPPFITTDTGEEARRKIIDSGEPIIEAAAQHLLEQFNDFDQINQRERIFFNFDGERTFVEVSPLKDGRGLDWLTIVIIPAQDFMAPVYEHLRMTIMLGVLVLVIATLLGFFLARWIIRPILVVGNVAAAIEGGRFETEPLESVTGRTDELGQLARVFQRMANEVHAREEQLKQQLQVLRIEIDEKKRQQQVKEIVDTDFFADLQAKAQSIRRRRVQGAAAK